MKKRTWIAGIVAIIIVILIIGIYLFGTTNSSTMLTSEEVTDMVNNQYPGAVVEADISDENDEVYKVVVETNEIQYYLQVNGIDGTIMDIQSEEIASAEPDDSERQEAIDEQVEENEEEESQVIGVEQAKEIAMEQFSGTVVDMELDEDDGRLLYELEVESSRGEAEIEVDAYTGEVIVVDIDLDDD